MKKLVNKIQYRPEIDFLRAIAVSAVIIYHAKVSLFGQKLFQGGYLGVDIFFVISGYLITSIIFKELESKNNFSFSKFYLQIFPYLKELRISYFARFFLYNYNL